MNLFGTRARRRVQSIVAFSLTLSSGLLSSPTILAAPGAAPIPFAILRQDKDFEAASRSQLITLDWPGNAERLTNAETAKKMATFLTEYSLALNWDVNETEFVGWDLENGKNEGMDEVRTKVIDRLKTAGYSYRWATGDLKEKSTPAGPLRFFTAVNEKTGSRLIGYWIDSKEGLVLGWAKAQAAGGGASGSSEKAPSTLQGSWQATVISGISTYSTTTGAYTGAGGLNCAQTYQFLPNGQYKGTTYISSRQYGRHLETFTWESGTYSVSGGKITFKITSGKYQVKDNSSSSNNYTRPMRSDEMKKNSKSYYYRMTTDENTRKPVLKMGSDASSLTTYKRQS